jgi:hypothetical protein
MAPVSTTFVPPVTGNYKFWVASDDYGKLYLHEDLNSLLSVSQAATMKSALICCISPASAHAPHAVYYCSRKA